MATVQEQRTEALDRARNGNSLGNYATIIRGFVARGIAAEDIEPRVNVFTYRAWQALKRQVRRGERGIRVATYRPCQKKTVDSDGTEHVERFTRPGMASVFHVSQTDPMTDGA